MEVVDKIPLFLLKQYTVSAICFLGEVCVDSNNLDVLVSIH